MSENGVHPFERTLGVGPYKLVGFFALQLPSESNQGRNNFHLAPLVEKGMGSCAHCGHAIINVYIISIGDGKRFGVGSDCIMKVGLPHQEISKLQKMEKERQKQLRKARKEIKGSQARNQLREIMENNPRLKVLPHPSIEGLTLFDYASWTVQKSSDGGIVFSLKRIVSLLQNDPKE